MMASIALVGCTNDDLIDNGIENNQGELVRGDAYVNFVISTKTDSSRGTVGDGDGSADNSGHEVAGTQAENAVNELLLVIAKAVDGTSKTEPVLYTNVMTEDANKVQNGYVGYFSGTDLSTTNGVVSLSAPIRLDYTGDYAVLAVVNPTATLKSSIAPGSDHKAAYEAILAYAGEAYDKANNTNFQMSNKEACVITATPENNVPTKPVNAKIAVERTVSKTTWRWAEPLTSAPGALAQMKNLYEVNVAVKMQTPEQGSFWYKKAETGYDAYLYSEEFNKAKDAQGNIYWVLFKDNDAANTDAQGKIIKSEVEAIFAASATYEQYTGVIDDTDKNNTDDMDGTQSVTGREITDDLLSQDYATAQAAVTDANVQKLTFVYNSTATDSSDKYYVNLTHYALTNKTTSVYAVRHIDSGSAIRSMGILGSNEYLATPYYADINDGEAVTFAQDLATVKAEAAAFSNGVTGTTFKALPTSETVGAVGTAHDGTTNVGAFMEYLYENSCKNGKINGVDIANPSTVTGIVLAGDIYDETGVKVPVLYKYNQKYYRTLQALLNANPNVTAFANLTPNSTNDAATAAGIDVYPNGRCYYYSAEIKHFEDSSPKEIGVMEYAIMRNNIYSLGVKSIEGIGDARIDVTENTPITDIRSYVQLEVSILPWIVRFNDLEL